MFPPQHLTSSWFRRYPDAAQPGAVHRDPPGNRLQPDIALLRPKVLQEPGKFALILSFSRWEKGYNSPSPAGRGWPIPHPCLLYTSDAADDLLCVDLGGRRIIK